jgi:uncharacterized membrane protein
MEEHTPSQMKEETTDSLCAGAVVGLIAFGSSVLTNQKETCQHTYWLL